MIFNTPYDSSTVISKMEDYHIDEVNLIRNSCRKFLHDDREFSLEQTREWFKNVNPEWYVIVQNDGVIGYFRTSNHSQKDRYMYIGADLEENSRGKGIAKIAYKHMMHFLFSKHRLNELRLEVLEDNARAISLYTKLGFKESHKTNVWREGWVHSIHMTLKRIDFILMQLHNDDEFVLSPCIGICKKTEDGCIACGRTLDEIITWKSLDNSQRISYCKRTITNI